MKLARFRADPMKLRVSWRKRTSGVWVVKLTRLDTGWELFAVAPLAPEASVSCLLERACLYGWPGVDLLCEGAYPHPHIQEP